MNWTEEQVREWMRKLNPPDLVEEKPVPAKAHKFHAKAKEVDGIKFSSTREARAYQQLRAEENLGRIRHLEIQPRYLLQEAFRDRDGKHHRKIEYVADFRFDRFDGGWSQVAVDVKGFKTPMYALKLKLFKAKYPDVHFEEWK